MEEHLYSPCPVSGCANNNGNPTYWRHYDCGGLSKIRYEDITLSCDKCS